MSIGNSATHSIQKSNSGFRRHALYFGLQSRVARALGVNRATVCQVMTGSKTSARVSKALEKEIARIERVIARSEERAA